MEKMKNTALLLVLFLLLNLFAGCSGEEEDGKDVLSLPQADQGTSYTSRLVYRSQEPLIGLEKTGTEVWLHGDGQRALLGEGYEPGVFEVSETGPDSKSVVVGENAWSITETGEVQHNGEPVTLPDDAYYTPMGFWKIEEADYLAVLRRVYDSVEIEVVLENELLLYPLGEALGTPVWVEEILPGGSITCHREGWNYYVQDGNLFRTDGKTLETLGNLAGYGIRSVEIRDLLPVGNDLLVLTGDMLILLAGSEETEAVSKPEAGTGTVVVGAFGADHIFENMITQYNLSSKNKIEVKYFDSQTSLNLAVLSGEVDMVVSFAGDSLIHMAKQGYLIPVEDLIGDLLNSGGFFDGVLDALRLDGKVTLICPMFESGGMILPKPVMDRVGEIETVAELIDVLEGLNSKNFYKQHTREIAMNNFIFNGMSAWVDLENGTCNFEEESFVDLLKLLQNYARDQDEVFANNAPDKGIFDPYRQIPLFSEIQDVNHIFYNDGKSETATYQYGTEGVLFPSPTQPGEGYPINPRNLFGVLASSDVKGSITDFLEWMLSEEVQAEYNDRAPYEGFGIPVRRDVVENCIEEWLKPREGIYYGISEEERRQGYLDTLAVLDQADHLSGSFYYDIYNIVQEEAAVFFAGDKDAETTAAHIQSRVSIFLAEQS